MTNLTKENEEKLARARRFFRKRFRHKTGPYAVFKRFLDIGGSFVMLIFFLLLLPFFALAIKLDSKGPVIFSQERVGRDMKMFRMYKFRTMVADAEEHADEVRVKGEFIQKEHDPRVTRVGAVLRKYSLDELPQLFNIFKGEMSLVGPRPFIVEETLMCKSKHLVRYTVRPGVTGYAQVNGRSDLPLEERMKKDLYYVQHISFWLDMGIMFKTFFMVFTKRGAY